jgi:hypothetical protein
VAGAGMRAKVGVTMADGRVFASNAMLHAAKRAHEKVAGAGSSLADASPEALKSARAAALRRAPAEVKQHVAGGIRAAMKPKGPVELKGDLKGKDSLSPLRDAAPRGGLRGEIRAAIRDVRQSRKESTGVFVLNRDKASKASLAASDAWERSNARAEGRLSELLAKRGEQAKARSMKSEAEKAGQGDLFSGFRPKRAASVPAVTAASHRAPKPEHIASAERANAASRVALEAADKAHRTNKGYGSHVLSAADAADHRDAAGFHRSWADSYNNSGKADLSRAHAKAAKEHETAATAREAYEKANPAAHAASVGKSAGEAAVGFRKAAAASKKAADYSAKATRQTDHRLAAGYHLDAARAHERAVRNSDQKERAAHERAHELHMKAVSAHHAAADALG